MADKKNRKSFDDIKKERLSWTEANRRTPDNPYGKSGKTSGKRSALASKGDPFPPNEVWRGPGYYGWIQRGSNINSIHLVFVCSLEAAPDMIKLDRRKRSSGVMTVRYYEFPPEE